jgi:thiol-disulfide isomerase/thioredoxin
LKTFLIYISLLVITGSASAQTNTQGAAHLRNPGLPSFTLLNVDSTYFTSKYLQKNKETLIVYFNPECDHCMHQTDSLLAKIKKLKNIQILMATHDPLNKMKAFYKKYRLAKYSNIKLGRDVNFFFPPYYKIANLPFLILYNKKGNLVTTFEGITPVDKVLKAFADPA